MLVPPLVPTSTLGDIKPIRVRLRVSQAPARHMAADQGAAVSGAYSAQLAQYLSLHMATTPWWWPHERVRKVYNLLATQAGTGTFVPIFVA